MVQTRATMSMETVHGKIELYMFVVCVELGYLSLFLYLSLHTSLSINFSLSLPPLSPSPSHSRPPPLCGGGCVGGGGGGGGIRLKLDSLHGTDEGDDEHGGRTRKY